jgi:rSAM-associated Gly-rich repeat protein
MTTSDRRRFLKGILAALASTTSTLVLASTTSEASPSESITQPKPEQPGDIQERADRLANEAGATEQEVPVSAFLNRGFHNGVGGGFRNGGFTNGIGGGFRNGGFANGGIGGGFRNGGFANGVGGGFRNGAFRNW